VARRPALPLPAAKWLKPGSNDILVLELHDAPKTPEITGLKNIVSGPNTPFSVRLDLPPTF
jgi:hypothetical protein